MKTSLEHLPENKKKEIREILEIIKQEVNPEKVILFGSHATGKWVEDRYVEDGIAYSYISDYDFLVIIDKNGEKEYKIQNGIENRCMHYANAVSPIVHSIDYVNDGLAFGQYFFSDIVQEGILLFDSGRFEFVKPKVLTSVEEKEKAQRYFDIWFPNGNEFLTDANHGFKRKSLKKAIFELHQAAENYYNTVLLVFTGYKPKTHNLKKLRNYSKHLSGDLFSLFLFPPNDKKEGYLFDLLRRGYIDARYKQDYVITEDEFEKLLGKVTKMQEVVQKICEERINSFK